MNDDRVRSAQDRSKGDALYFWRFFSKRIDTLTDNLWKQVTWLIGLAGALIAFMVDRKIILWNSGGGLQVEAWPALLLGLAGAALSLFGMTLIWEIGKHVERNQWRQSHFAKEIPLLKEALELQKRASGAGHEGRTSGRAGDPKTGKPVTPSAFFQFTTLPAFCKVLIAIVAGFLIIFVSCMVAAVLRLHS